MIRRVGKKSRQWTKDKKELLKQLEKIGTHRVVKGTVFGLCPDCGHNHYLTPDHKKKRSQGGDNSFENIEWVCNTPPCMCHDKRDNMGDPKNKKIKNAKADWQKEHECKHCKTKVRTLLCSNCKKLSL